MLNKFLAVPAGVIATATLTAAGQAGVQPTLAAAASPVSGAVQYQRTGQRHVRRGER